MDNALIGQRIRNLRMERQLRQGDVAKQLGISPAYLNLIEKGKRTVQVPLLWKVLQLFEQDVDSFMREVGDARPHDGLAKLLDDPLARTLDLDEDDIALLQAEPKAATTIVALFHLYKNTRAQLDTTVAKLSEGEPPRLGYEPSDEVTDFLQKQRNFFPELEDEADRLRRAHRLGRRVISDQLALMLEKTFSVRVEHVSPAADSSVVRRIDRERGVVTLSTGLSEQALKFQIAASAGLLVLDANRLHERLITE